MPVLVLLLMWARTVTTAGLAPFRVVDGLASFFTAASAAVRAELPAWGRKRGISALRRARVLLA